MAENKEKVLSVKDLVISFKTDRGIVHAVRGVSFDLYKGETLCIVGESGSGKSVTNKAIMGISAANAIIDNGQILYRGEDLVRVSEEEFHRIRGHKIGMIFQDPLSALNPIMRVGKQITEATMINRNVLKRYYEELISDELTALRNFEANSNFSIKKYETEVEKNKHQIELIKELEKKISRSSTKLAKNKALETSSDEKAENKYQSLVNSDESLNKELASLKATIKDDFSIIVRSINEDIVNASDALKHVDEKVALLKSQNASELKLKIQENRRARYLERLAIYQELAKKDYTNEDLVYLLNSRNADLNRFIKVLKHELKQGLPALKEDLKAKKKVAHEETEKYHQSLIKKRDEDLKKLNDELASNEKAILDLRATLAVDELKHIDEIITHNEVALKKITKQAGKYKDNSISKTYKDSSLDILKTDNKKYDDLLAEKKLIEDKIIKVNENFINSTRITKAEAKREALEVMKEVGIPLPERRFKQYPFEFSGGMRQRIVIAIALTANPEILICDEPTTALDVTIQAQILELINKLKRERNLSCIFITHDLGVVANMADRVAVMYAGKIVEYGLANEVFFDPRHPYTWALLSSIPDVDSKEKLEAIPGTPPDMIYPPKGDAFALRSKYAMAIDFKYEPPFFKVTPTHYAATWLLYPGAPKVEMPRIVKTRIENALKLEKERVELEKKKEVNSHEEK